MVHEVWAKKFTRTTSRSTGTPPNICVAGFRNERLPLPSALAQRIREKLDYSVDPCNDFYKFVCNSFRGKNEFENVKDSTHLFTLLRLTVPIYTI
ncbi:hypothetical protein MRX96_054594 [Rhipicephalus microplus]